MKTINEDPSKNQLTAYRLALIAKIRSFLEMIKFEHTIFALPFAYLGYVLAAPHDIRWRGLAWVTAAMVFARTAGMCLNRLIDRHIDANNPRTSNRALVTGELKPGLALAAACISLVLLVVCAASLNPLCLALSPLAVLLLVAYHYLKRFTAFCHFGIGAVLACAPIGGWAGAVGRLEAAPFLLGAAVFFWVAGFDLFYSLQDMEFDRSAGLHSVPALYGEEAAVRLAQFAHLFTLISLVWLGIILSLQTLYWVGLALSAAILITEHILISKDRKKHVKTVFFTMNGVLSTLFFVTTFIAVRLS